MSGNIGANPAEDKLSKEEDALFTPSSAGGVLSLLFALASDSLTLAFSWANFSLNLEGSTEPASLDKP
ncbi:hypothetical protein FTO72_14105 [Escherichia coli]|uniref:hypothetical protein n=1 Tax=Escherichia coli TaxID=562 RepID=UPI00124898B4|nr:hypothetical protein FTO72_14105 [Escherichia coli]